MIHLLVMLVCAIIAYVALYYIVSLIPVPAPLAWAKQAILIVIAAVFLIYILMMIAGGAEIHSFR